MHTIEYCMLMKISFRWHFKSENRALQAIISCLHLMWKWSEMVHFFRARRSFWYQKCMQLKLNMLMKNETDLAIYQHLYTDSTDCKRKTTATLLPLSNWIYHDKFTTQKVGHKTEQRHILCLIPRYYEERRDRTRDQNQRGTCNDFFTTSTSCRRF